MIFEFLRFERSGFLLHDVLRKVQHILGDFDVLDLVEIFLRIADFVGVAQQRAHQSLIERLQCDDMFTAGQHDASDCDLVHRADGLADDREGVVTHLAVGPQIIGADQIAWIDLVLVDELVDLDRAGRLQRDVLEFLLATSMKVSVSSL